MAEQSFADVVSKLSTKISMIENKIDYLISLLEGGNK